MSDDGRGFDPETTVARAARAGRLGLVGMHERVRMLGGQTQIDSRPGGPTVVSAVLPRWDGEDDVVLIRTSLGAWPSPARAPARSAPRGRLGTPSLR